MIPTSVFIKWFSSISNFSTIILKLKKNILKYFYAIQNILETLQIKLKITVRDVIFKLEKGSKLFFIELYRDG